MNRLTLALLCCLSLAACSFGGPPHPQTTYVLSDPQAVSAAANATTNTTTTPRWPGVLLIEDMETPAFYRSPALAFSRETGTRGHYQYARFTDPPGPALTDLISRRLQRAGLFQGISAPGQGVQGPWQLNLRLNDLFHDASQSPGVVQLSFEAELVERASGRMLSRRTITAQVPATSLDAAGAASAANRAVGNGLDQLALWLQEAR